MASSEQLSLAAKLALSPAEMDDVGALVREAGWNQIETDWRIFLELGHVYAAQTVRGRIVATTATLPFGGRFAWISMVLVAGDYRRRGLATRLMRRAMDDLVAAGRWCRCSMPRRMAARSIARSASRTRGGSSG